MSMHIISARDDGVKLWKNVSFYQKDEPNIVNKRHINTTEKSKVSNNIVVGDCVKIISGLFQATMLWSLVQAMVMKMRFSVLLRRKQFLGQNIGFSKKTTSSQEKSVSSRKL